MTTFSLWKRWGISFLAVALMITSVLPTAIHTAKAEINLIQNGDFSNGLTDWTGVKVQTSTGIRGEYPIFEMLTDMPHGSIDCTPSGRLDNPFLNIEVPFGANGYVEQQVTIPSSATHLSFVSWGNELGLGEVNAYVTVVDASGTPHTLETFTPPPMLNPGDPNNPNDDTCTGNSPVSKSYDLSAYSGQTVQLRLGATSQNCCGTNAFFDDVQVSTAPDLSIRSLRPVQAVFNSDVNHDSVMDLVQRKSTALIAEVQIAGTIGPSLELQIKFTFNSLTIVKSLTFEMLRLQGNKIVFEFIPGNVGDQTMTVTLDPNNIISETDETNNSASLQVNVKDTRALKVAYFRVTPACFILCPYGAPTEFDSSVGNSSVFARATFPLAEGEFSNEKRTETYVGDPIPFVGLLDDAISLWLYGQLLAGADRTVGIVSSGYFGYHQEGSYTTGATFPGINGVLVREGFWDTTAHEIGHTYGLPAIPVPPSFKEEYNDTYSGHSATGYWANSDLYNAAHRIDPFVSREVSDTVSFMGTSLYHSFGRWVNDTDYTKLFRAFLQNQQDPEILLLNGVVLSNGTISLGKLYSSERGTVNIPLPGDMSVQILDFEGLVLSEISFGTSFSIHVDPIGSVPIDRTGFTLSIPFSPGSWTVRINKAGRTVVEINPTIKLLHDAIDSIPGVGFIDRPVQRRKALHETVNAIEEMVKRKAVDGAVKALGEGLLKQVSLWLLDSYTTISPLEFSKQQVVSLIEELASRLEGIRDSNSPPGLAPAKQIVLEEELEGNNYIADRLFMSFERTNDRVSIVTLDLSPVRNHKPRV